MPTMIPPEEEYRQINIRLSDEEIACVRDIVKVDAVAPAVVSIVRRAIEEYKKAKAGAK